MSIQDWKTHIAAHVRHDPVTSFLLEEIQRLSGEVRTLQSMGGHFEDD